MFGFIFGSSQQTSSNTMADINTPDIPKVIIPNSASQQHPELQYINLIKHIIQNGDIETGRNGNTKHIFGHNMRFSLENNTLPLLTSKFTPFGVCLKELLWFISGDTNNHTLNSLNVHIWDGNSTKEFMQSRNLEHYEDGLLGPIYGYQWRHFNSPYDYTTGKPLHDLSTQYSNIDQLQYIIEQLKNPDTRNSRRLILTAWNPAQLDEMALPPCHILCQFKVTDSNKLSCLLFQRSCDCALGVPFNIASYSMFTHIIATHCGLIAKELIYTMGDCHLYEDHVQPIQDIFNRELYEFPKFIIKNIKENIDDYVFDDFILDNYKYNPKIIMNMVA